MDLYTLLARAGWVNYTTLADVTDIYRKGKKTLLIDRHHVIIDYGGGRDCYMFTYDTFVGYLKSVISIIGS